MIQKLQNKVAVITGGASGIGAASAKQFIAHGAKVAIGDVNVALGESFVGELNKQAGSTVAVFAKTDVTSFEQVDALCALAEKEFGRLDIIFNNAGIGGVAETPDLAIEEWKKVLDIDLNGVFYGCKSAIPRMRKVGGGVIVNNASISGLRADYGWSAYNAAKGAVVNYTRTLALDHAKDNIRVNVLCPGWIETPLTQPTFEIDIISKAWRESIPMQRGGTAEEVANVVLFLVSDDASYVTGTTMIVDGGLSASNGQPNIPKILTQM